MSSASSEAIGLIILRAYQLIQEPLDKAAKLSFVKVWFHHPPRTLELSA
jgi:hypothetical protein